MMMLSNEFPVKRVCRVMGVNRSGFYAWKGRTSNPSPAMLGRATVAGIFRDLHEAHPSHGYRWLNAKARLDYGIAISDPTAYGICRSLGIRSRAERHYRYKRPGDPSRLYPNLLLQGLRADGPLQCVVSDMTAFWLGGAYFELTIYMDLWDNEVVSYALSSKKGDRNTYIEGLKTLLEIKKEHPGLEMVLHTDRGSVYSSKSFNELLPQYHIIRSMSRAGTPTDNAAMESINGWIKPEMRIDGWLRSPETVKEDLEAYFRYFNEGRPSYALGYMTPKQYREAHEGKMAAQKGEAHDQNDE